MSNVVITHHLFFGSTSVLHPDSYFVDAARGRAQAMQAANLFKRDAADE